jgi:hypothetical protein
MRDSLLRGEAPLATHALYTQPGVLDDTVPEQRAMGMEAGFRWAREAGLWVFYIDLGWSPGMRAGLIRARKSGTQTRTRTLGAPWSDMVPSDTWFDAAAAD